VSGNTRRKVFELLEPRSELVSGKEGLAQAFAVGAAEVVDDDVAALGPKEVKPTCSRSC
jgi:hypothetical protein